jgi:hypothetical protein
MRATLADRGELPPGELVAAADLLQLGCPRNNQIIFFVSNRNKPKLNLFRLFFGLFHETKKHFFWFVSVFRTVIETTETDRIFSQQTEKNLQKTFSIGGPRNRFFISRFEPKQPKFNLFRLFFGLLFREKKKKIVGLFRCFGPVSKQTELMVWVIKKVDISTNLLLFRFVFFLFRLFRNTETPCFDTEAKQPKQTSCFG